MTDPINGVPRNRTETLGTQNDKTRGTAGATTGPDNKESSPATSTSNADTVSITSEANRVRELQNSLSEVPDIDLEKVAAIKEEIANGNYPIDHERIAQNLIDLEKTLLQ